MPLPRKAILLLLDSLPLGELGCYGGFREKTPGFDRLAAKGTVFENAYTPWVTDSGSAFDEQGPWSAAWRTLLADLRREGCPLDEVVCSTLAELTEAASPERVGAFLNRAEAGLLAISGPELLPPPVHGHLSVVDEVVAALHAAIEEAGATETLLIVGALQGASPAGASPADEDGVEDAEDAYRPAGLGESDNDSFPRLVAQRVNVPLLLRTDATVVPGLRVQALATTMDTVATLRGWLLPGDEKPLDPGHARTQGFDLLPLVRCEQEAVRQEILIRGPGEIAVRTLDRYVVVRRDDTAANCDGVLNSAPGPGDDDRHDGRVAVAVFRKPGDVWDRLDVGNTMPEERDLLVRLCQTLSAQTSDGSQRPVP